jgi:hypothetical protein
MALLGTSAEFVSCEILGCVQRIYQRTSQGVRDEEDGKSDVVLSTTHVQVWQKALDLRISWIIGQQDFEQTNTGDLRSRDRSQDLASMNKSISYRCLRDL